MFDLETRILIVDDMGAMRKVISKMVKEMGFLNLCEAVDGDDAWAAISSSVPPIGLVISDLNMPHCSGQDLLLRIRADEQFKNLPFLMVTAESEGRYFSSALAAGVDGYVIKPFEKSDLGEKISNIYNKKCA